MYLTRTLGRWQIELHQRALYLTRLPAADPDCVSCGGLGGHGYITQLGDGDWADCHCVTGPHAWSLRLWPRRNPAKEYPF
ncbi:hypothetical protein ABT034_33755 [Streptomyces sp. NPDC002773]|uniref:hypothetical protein n=1 Tax=Streptomyces sp. NPDC002773 TaxID=3154430 RepID=UPI00331FB09B